MSDRIFLISGKSANQLVATSEADIVPLKVIFAPGFMSIQTSLFTPALSCSSSPKIVGCKELANSANGVEISKS